MKSGRYVLGAALLLVPAMLPGQAQQSASVPASLANRQPSVAVTKHTGAFGGQSIGYTATVEEHILKGADSVPNASLVTIAYVRDDVADNSRRPVTFVFNGGPGASSSPLHFQGVGPRIGDRNSAVNNPHSILDVTDLVFIDPVGTGFSRPYSEDAGKQYYWSDNGDAAAVHEVILRWVRKNGRDHSPRYLMGESYGTNRNGNILRNYPGTKFDGVIMVAATTAGGGPDAGILGAFPSMAAAAWYHNVIPRNGRTVNDVWDEALAFTRGAYAAALAKGDALSAAEKTQMAEKMSALTGLPVAFIEERNIRLRAQDWLMNILKDKGLRVSNQDTRETGPLVLDSATAARMSPAAGLGGTAAIGMPGSAGLVSALAPGSDTARLAEAALGTRNMSALERYLRNDLQFKTVEFYRSLNLDINPCYRGGQARIGQPGCSNPPGARQGGGAGRGAVAAGGGRQGGRQAGRAGAPAAGGAAGSANAFAGPAGGVAARMQIDPAFRMFWIQGLYDLNTPAYSAIASYERANLPASRYTGMMAPGPHTAFATEESRAALSVALRKWFTQR